MKYDEAKYLAEKDFLTETYNRRYISRIFPKLLKKVIKENGKLCILVIDINNFKQINDTTDMVLVIKD